VERIDGDELLGVLVRVRLDRAGLRRLDLGDELLCLGGVAHREGELHPSERERGPQSPAPRRL